MCFVMCLFENCVTNPLKKFLKFAGADWVERRRRENMALKPEGGAIL